MLVGSQPQRAIRWLNSLLAQQHHSPAFETPREEFTPLLSDGFEDADSRELLNALRKRFLPPLGLLLRRRLVAGYAVVNVAFLSLAEIKNAASTLAVNENSGFGIGALRCWRERLPFRKSKIRRDSPAGGSTACNTVEHRFQGDG